MAIKELHIPGTNETSNGVLDAIRPAYTCTYTPKISLFKRVVVRTCSTTSNSTNDEVCVSMSLCVHLQEREREREIERERGVHVSVYKNLCACT